MTADSNPPNHPAGDAATFEVVLKKRSRVKAASRRSRRVRIKIRRAAAQQVATAPASETAPKQSGPGSSPPNPPPSGLTNGSTPLDVQFI